jgi:hypothetical protein
MHNSLSWIEWLDRLERIVTSARRDVASVWRSSSARGLAAIERSTRQLTALTDELRLLDYSVFHAGIDELQRALDTAILHLGLLAAWEAAPARVDRDRILAAIDSALRECSDEAHALVSPRARDGAPGTAMAGRA